MFNKHDYKILSMKFNTNRKAKTVRTLSLRELLQKHGEILAKSWQLDKSKKTYFHSWG